MMSNAHADTHPLRPTSAKDGTATMSSACGIDQYKG